MSPREPSGASKSQKAAFSKTLKNYILLVFLDPEASQENLKRPEKAPKKHPKRHPKVVQKLVKTWSKSEPKNGQKVEKKRVRKTKNRSDQAFLLARRPSKNAYFKTLSRCLKTVPK